MESIRLTHIGGPTTLIEIGPWRLLTDPTFDAPGRRYYFGWGSGSRKVAGPAIAADDLAPIDAVLLSHDHHADNLDDAGRAFLPKATVVITTVSGARRLGANARALAAWDSMQLRDASRPTLDITATPCRHGPPASHFLVGDAIGFALRWDAQQNGLLWVSGDTVLYDGVREVAKRFRIGTAILHLGAVRFPVTGPLHYTMTARDAVDVCTLLQPRIAVPIHYEGWTHFKQGRAAIAQAFAAAPRAVRDSVRWLPMGRAVEFDA
ncbi:MAG: MBL fold metallo-hydrolase [Gemmatimonadaceae bacterium]